MGIFTAIGKIMAANKIEAKINAIKENACDVTVKALTEQLKQKRVFNVSTGVNFVDTKTPKLLSELIPFIKSSKNISESAKEELFVAMVNSEYFKPSPKHSNPEHDQLIQQSIMTMQEIDRMNNEMFEFQQQQQQLDQQFQQQQFEQMNDMF